MAENGPGGREVGRVSLRVLPDTSKFLPSLKKYAERVERTVAVRLGASVDARGLEADVARISATMERAAPTIRIPATPVSDGFGRELQAQVRAAARTVEANIPLTADGERFRRQVSVEIAQLEADIARLDVEVPLDVEGAARARAELVARVASLQAYARSNGVEIPLSVGSSGFKGLGPGGIISPAAIASLSGVAAVLSGSVLASLPAIVASIAAPVAVIALGFEGIKTAAETAAPAFQSMRDALDETFASELTPVFQTLADILPKITGPLQRIAESLSGAFGVIVDQIASPEGLASLTGILDGIADAIEILSPSLGPVVQALLDMAETGMAAFVDAAPALNDALSQMAGIFTALNDSGAIRLAADAFAGFVIAGTYITGAVAAILIAIAAAEQTLINLRTTVAGVIGNVIEKFNGLVAGISRSIQSAVDVITKLPGKITGALSGLGSTLFGSGAALIQGFIDGILSKLGPIGTAAATVAQAVKDFFPGSPVKEGPLTSWNNGGAGKSLGDLLASGLESSRSTVRSASAGLAGSIVQPSLVGAGVGSSRFDRDTPWRDPYLMADVLEGAMRRAPLEVSAREAERSIARVRNGREQM